MEWVDDGVVIGLRLHGETGVVVELLTRRHGRHSGFVHGGRSRRQRPVLQPGNDVRASWKARQEDQLGTLVVEGLELRAARIMESALALHGTNLICALARLLPEREPQPVLHAVVTALLDSFAERDASGERDSTPAALARFELALLGELGFGLDLARCALTGTAEDLAFVSPKTGRAVSRVAGMPYRDRILPLPGFMLAEALIPATPADLAAGFRLTGHFLTRNVFAPRGLVVPDCRRAYLRALQLPPA
ncbi:DNA repair protein RecO [Lichenihabitans sp. Uapishka_5]|uniref:DNA repair protein RecO n=1 Tax=Lichenihabitans sp. Uapishka_5 TaxID=3037302 RepID=UPI0029E7FBB4|nr:DNA repair protein RecO [Lichenihabitans sp. Uapishka_5]MDX7950771.1 DNA repair protein RecO [Lichenihabitans sp. Uapishka_5]